MNSDSSVKKYKSNLRPILPENERAEMVAALACVDYVTIFNDNNPINFLEFIKPDIHTKGGDYDIKELLETPTIYKNGGKVVIIPRKVQSTTNIIERITKIYGSKNSQKK